MRDCDGLGLSFLTDVRMTQSGSAGGAAGAGGFSFQDSVTAWAAVGVLAEQAVTPRWGLDPATFFTEIRCETGLPVDDLRNKGNWRGDTVHNLLTDCDLCVKCAQWTWKGYLENALQGLADATHPAQAAVDGGSVLPRHEPRRQPGADLWR